MIPQNRVITSKWSNAAITLIATSDIKNRKLGDKGQLTPSMIIPIRTVAMRKLSTSVSVLSALSKLKADCFANIKDAYMTVGVKRG